MEITPRITNLVKAKTIYFAKTNFILITEM